MNVTVGISGRHVHLKEEDLKILFGENYELEVEKPINQPGQFASKSFVTIETEKGKLEHVRILGPIRKYTQIEISKTDSIKLGINPPVRMSGDLDNSEIVTLIGPNGSIKTNGCIIADRHIHMLEKQAEMYGFKKDEIVDVLVDGKKGGILANVHLRIADDSYFEMHIDTDDANANLIKNNDILTILKRK